MATRSVTEALEAVYSTTDCCNGVFDWHTPKGFKFFLEAERLGLLRSEICELCDDDGCLDESGRQAIGFQLTDAGYEALTVLDPVCYPNSNRRLCSTKREALEQQANQRLDELRARVAEHAKG